MKSKFRSQLFDSADGSWYKGLIKKYAEFKLVKIERLSEDTYQFSWTGPSFKWILEREEKLKKGN